MTTTPSQFGIDQEPQNPYGNLFKPPQTPQSILRQGNLVGFNYSFFRHDPFPVVIISSVIPGQRIKGVNIHYLTFPYIKNILQKMNPTFSYTNIRGDRYITNAFREYKWAGIRQLKELDIEFVLNAMGSLRALDPNELDAIRQSAQEQIQERMNEPAEATPEQEPIDMSETE